MKQSDIMMTKKMILGYYAKRYAVPDICFEKSKNMPDKRLNSENCVNMKKFKALGSGGSA